jgi:protein-disulfide isomerase
MSRPRVSIDPYFLAGTAAVLLAGAFVLFRERSPAALPDLSGAVSVLDTIGAAHRLGSRSAPVRVGVLSDYECEGCAVAHERVWPALRRHVDAGTVLLTVYETPLPGHARGLRAAAAAKCVEAASPDAYWRYHAVLFARRAAWRGADSLDAVLTGLGREAGSDPGRLRACLESEGETRAAALARGWAVASGGGAPFVPLFLVNGRPVDWLRLESEIERALEGRS